jgi:hypothetical protein
MRNIRMALASLIVAGWAPLASAQAQGADAEPSKGQASASQAPVAVNQHLSQDQSEQTNAPAKTPPTVSGAQEDASAPAATKTS